MNVDLFLDVGIDHSIKDWMSCYQRKTSRQWAWKMFKEARRILRNHTQKKMSVKNEMSLESSELLKVGS
jgi:hypothetical protein